VSGAWGLGAEAWAARAGARGPWTTIDSHTEGEATRLVVAGVEGLEAGDVPAKRRMLAAEQDHLRKLLMREPRGHRDLFGAVLTPPAETGSHFGLVYMDARRYPYLCGHATIGAVTTWLELGPEAPAEDGARVVRVDTPSGTVEATAEVQGGRVLGVEVELQPALAYALGHEIQVEGLGRLEVDVVLVGGFFAMVDAARAGLSLDAPEALADLGARVREAANEAIEVQHPERPYIDTIDVVSFYGPGGEGAHGRNVVVYGAAHVDRSPCGTGTCARMALEHTQGKLRIGDAFVNEGPLGSRFEGRLVGEATLGGRAAVRPRVRGRAYVTGVQTFFLPPEDPLPEGYLLG